MSSFPRFSEQTILDGIRSAVRPVEVDDTDLRTFPPNGTFVQTHGWRFFGGTTYFFRNVENHQYGWCSQGRHDDHPGPLRYPYASLEEAVQNMYDMGVMQYVNLPNYWPWLLGWVEDPTDY